jgi:hypothetical protein
MIQVDVGDISTIDDHLFVTTIVIAISLTTIDWPTTRDA